MLVLLLRSMAPSRRKLRRDAHGRFCSASLTDGKEECCKVGNNVGCCQAAQDQWLDNITAEELYAWKTTARKSERHSGKPLFDGICFSCGALLWRPNHVKYVVKTGLSAIHSPPILRKYPNLPRSLPYEAELKSTGTSCWMACADCASDWTR